MTTREGTILGVFVAKFCQKTLLRRKRAVNGTGARNWPESGISICSFSGQWLFASEEPMRESLVTNEQIAAILREADRTSVAEAAKKKKVSEQTIYIASTLQG